MYLTTCDDSKARGSVLKAGLNGTDPREIVSGLQSPGGIVIDHSSSKLFWTDHFANRIQSSDLDGGNVTTIAKLEDGAGPWGIALYDSKLFWSNYKAMTLQTAEKSGEHIQMVHTAVTSMTHLILVSSDVPKTYRPNEFSGISRNGNRDVSDAIRQPTRVKEEDAKARTSSS